MKLSVQLYPLYVLLVFCSAGCAGAQHASTAARCANEDEKIKNLPGTDRNSFSAVLLNDISIHAVRDFMRSYKHAANVRWFKVNDEAVVYFTDHNIKTKVWYNYQGEQLSSIRTYPEALLPGRIRAKIKSRFNNFSIAIVNEVTVEDQTVYMVTITNGSICETIQVGEGELIGIKKY